LTVAFAVLAACARTTTSDGHEALLVVGFLTIGAAPTVGCAAVGVLIAQIAINPSGMGAGVEAGTRAATAALAGSLFVLSGGPGQGDVIAGAIACVAVVLGSVLEAYLHLQVGRRPTVYGRWWVAVAPAVLVAAGTAPIGMAAVLLAGIAPATTIALVPVAIAVVLPGRWIVREREERHRTTQVLAASARAAGLRSFEEALAVAAQEGCHLGEGLTALCCATGPGGAWTGTLVAAGTMQPATPDQIAVVLELAASDGPVVELRDRLLPVRLALPPAEVVTVVQAADSAVPVILAVLRNGSPADADLLQRFVSQVSLSIANARLYDDVERAYRQQLDLNRQKGEFVATVSHELRTPVAAVMGTLETVTRLGDRLDTERRAQLLSSALEYGDRLTRVIEELLLVASAEQSSAAVAVTDVDVPPLVSRLAGESAAVTDGRLVTVMPARMSVRTDEHKLARILVNLIENAAKYAPDGPIELEVITAGPRAVFFVVDHGPGIAPEDRHKVFERFVQLDQSLTRPHGGLGLGLYLCRQLARLLDGELVLTETPGGGCTFCLAIARQLDGDVEGRPQNGAVMRRPTAVAS
jgi:signal transduction histidine kinase